MSCVEGTVDTSTQKQLNQDLCPLVEEMGVKGGKTITMAIMNAKLLSVIVYK